MNDINMNPEYYKLTEEVKQLKEDIASLYEEKDELVYHICKNIEAEYMSKVGILEYKLYEFNCKILRLKRKIELYQQKINMQELPDENEIENKLDKEYSQYEKKLNSISNTIQKLLYRKNLDFLSEEESREIKKVYRKLIKKLHPDLTKENNKQKEKLLIQVTNAYKQGDIETLKNIELLTEEVTEKTNTKDIGLIELRECKTKYKRIIDELLESIKKIKESFPYNQKEFLKSDVLVNKRKEELERDTEQYKDIYSKLEDMKHSMLYANKALLINKDYAYAHYRKAWALQESGQFEEALDGYSKAIELDPTDIYNYLGIACVSLNTQANINALLYANKAIMLDRNCGGAYYYKSLALSNLGKCKEAEKAYAQAVKLGYMPS